MLRAFKRRVDPRRYNGATLIGLKGVVVKSHGSADALAFQHALRKAYAEAAHGVLDKIAQRMAAMPASDARSAPCADGDRVRPAMHSRIVGTGSYLPAQIAHQRRPREARRHERRVDRRAHRHPRAPHRRAGGADERSRAEHAARAALEAAGIAPADVDLIIVATTTPDMVFPSTACILQAKLGARGGPAFDVQAVCSGFVYALADRRPDGRRREWRSNALVVGAEIYSRILDWNDRGTCVLFGDGAGAVVLAPSRAPGIGSAHLHADGSYRNILCVPGTVADGEVSGTPFVQMDGPAVFKFAVSVMAEVGAEALEANGVDASAIDWLIPHQANIRIMEATAKKLRLPLDRVIATVDRHANTSAASIPLALDEAVRDGRIAPGHRRAADRRRRRLHLGLGAPDDGERLPTSR